nr:Maf family protein [Lachnospiraceae bacterium]
KTKSFYEETRVYVAKLDDREIDEYIESGQPFDKAGGYGIQTFFCRYITKIEGDYNNVMGLPIARIYRELKDI